MRSTSAPVAPTNKEEQGEVFFAGWQVVLTLTDNKTEASPARVLRSDVTDLGMPRPPTFGGVSP